MTKANNSWGIEVGANAIKAMNLVRHGSRVELEDYDIIPFKQVLTTPDLNVDEIIQVSLDLLMTRHDLSRSNVVVSVPGHMAFARFAKMPPVEPKKIPDIVRFEAIQQIPFPIDQVEWDYQVFQQEDAPDVEVGIFAITKERVMMFLNNYRKVGMQIDALTLSPIAVYNAFKYDTAEDADADGTIYMDIGSQSTDVIIVEGGGIWLRTLPIGGNNFTEALVRAFKLSFPKAEKLKKEAGTSKYARQIFQAMRPVFADLVQELQRSLGYYQSLNRDAQLKRVVGVGSTFRLPGLKKFLKQQLQMEVDRVDGFKRIHVEGKRESEFAEHAMNMATAYGLALQGLGLESVSANILPSHILKQRMWNAKQPWIGAAAGFLLVASGLSFAAYLHNNHQFERSRAELEPRIQSVLATVNRYNQELRQIEPQDPRQRIENLRRLLDYRDLWPKLFEDINMAMAALGPQAELLSGDPQAIAQIPRIERRRIYVRDIRFEYVAERVGDAAGAGTDSYDEDMYGGYGAGGMGPGMGPGMGGMGGMGTTQQGASDVYDPNLNVDNFFAAERGDAYGDGLDQADGQARPATARTTPRRQAPALKVTLTGTTPYAKTDTADFLEQNFINWLKENAIRADRPYRIEVTEALASIRQMPADEATDRPRPRDSRPSTSPRLTPGGTTGRTPPGMMLEPGGMLGSPGATRQPTATADLGDYLPPRPLADESRREDRQFTIQWTIKLVKPEEARQAAASIRQQGPAGSPVDIPDAPDMDAVPDEMDGADGDVPLPVSDPATREDQEVQ